MADTETKRRLKEVLQETIAECTLGVADKWDAGKLADALIRSGLVIERDLIWQS